MIQTGDPCHCKSTIYQFSLSITPLAQYMEDGIQIFQKEATVTITSLAVNPLAQHMEDGI